VRHGLLDVRLSGRAHADAQRGAAVRVVDLQQSLLTWSSDLAVSSPCIESLHSVYAPSKKVKVSVNIRMRAPLYAVRLSSFRCRVETSGLQFIQHSPCVPEAGAETAEESPC
jgi:hypothetical protein